MYSQRFSPEPEDGDMSPSHTITAPPTHIAPQPAANANRVRVNPVNSQLVARMRDPRVARAMLQQQQQEQHQMHLQQQQLQQQQQQQQIAAQIHLQQQQAAFIASTRIPMRLNATPNLASIEQPLLTSSEQHAQILAELDVGAKDIREQKQRIAHKSLPARSNSTNVRSSTSQKSISPNSRTKVNSRGATSSTKSSTNNTLKTSSSSSVRDRSERSRSESKSSTSSNRRTSSDGSSDRKKTRTSSTSSSKSDQRSPKLSNNDHDHSPAKNNRSGGATIPTTTTTTAVDEKSKDNTTTVYIKYQTTTPGRNPATPTTQDHHHHSICWTTHITASDHQSRPTQIPSSISCICFLFLSSSSQLLFVVVVVERILFISIVIRMKRCGQFRLGIKLPQKTRCQFFIVFCIYCGRKKTSQQQSLALGHLVNRCNVIVGNYIQHDVVVWVVSYFGEQKKNNISYFQEHRV